MSYVPRNYVMFGDPAAVKALDKNRLEASNVTVFPRGLYSGQPLPTADNVCHSIRDPSTHYIIGVDRNDHPDHFSWYGYGRHYNPSNGGHYPHHWQNHVSSLGLERVRTSASDSIPHTPFVMSSSGSTWDPPDMAPFHLY